MVLITLGIIVYLAAGATFAGFGLRSSDKDDMGNVIGMILLWPIPVTLFVVLFLPIALAYWIGGKL